MMRDWFTKPSAHIPVQWPTRSPWPLHFADQHRVLQWLAELRRDTERKMAQKASGR